MFEYVLLRRLRWIDTAIRGARDGPVVRTHVFHQCGPGSISARCHIWDKVVTGWPFSPRSEGYSPSYKNHRCKFHGNQERRWCGFSLNNVIYLFTTLLYPIRLDQCIPLKWSKTTLVKIIKHTNRLMSDLTFPVQSFLNGWLNFLDFSAVLILQWIKSSAAPYLH